MKPDPCAKAVPCGSFRWFTPFAVGIALALAPAVVRAQPYAVVSVATALPGYPAVGKAINNAGAVVGYYPLGEFETYAYEYVGGVGTTLVGLPYSDMGDQVNTGTAMAINNGGAVVGGSPGSPVLTAAVPVIYGTEAASFLPGWLFLSGIGNLGISYGINDSGVIVGGYGNGYFAHAFSCSGGAFNDLGALPGDTYAVATAINNAGVIVGFSAASQTATPRAFVWSNGTLAAISTLGGTSCHAYAINSSGVVVGTSTTAAGAAHAVSWSGGVPTDLNALANLPEMTLTDAKGINSSGAIVGRGLVGTGSVYHAFLFKDGIAKDLNSLVSLPNSNDALVDAVGINDSGWILASDLDGSAFLLLLPPAQVIGTRDLYPPQNPIPYGSSPFTVTATASSGLPVVFTVVSGPATVSGNTVTVTGAGQVTIQASQPGNGTFDPAVAVTQTFTVGKAIPYVTWPNPGNLAAGTPLTVAQLNASANVAGTFSYDIPLGTVLPAGAQSVGVTFTPADFVDYSVTTARIYFKVEPASGGITTQNLLYISNGADGTNGYVTLVTASGATSTFADTLGMPVGLVFDAAGNLYVADYSHGTILKITPQGSRSVLATGFNGPVGMAVDASGTLFVSAYVSGTISKVSPSGKVSVLYAGLQMPNGLALDSLGNLYVAMDGSGTIGEISPSGQMTVYATGFNEPCGLAFDPAGNLYVADLGNLSIGKITPDGGLYTVATGLAHPFGIAIDGNGNIYAVDDADVTRITPAGVVSKFVTAGLSGPYAVAVNPLPLPSFSVQPVSQAVPVGHTVTLTAAEMGADSLQWYGPSGALAGATDATLTLSSIQASQAGIYTLAATNAAGVTSSNGATVGVITDTAPAVVTAPAPLTVAAGRSVAFSIAATGTPAPLYQWLLNGTPIAGATDPALVLSGASTTASGVVSCVVSNSGGTVTAQAALNVLSTSAPGRLVNLSARAAVGTGAGLMVGGLGISGSGTEDLLLRGVGPGLHDTFKLTGVLAAPQIGLFDGKGLLIASDTGWGSAPVPGASAASAAPQLASAELMSQVGAFSLAAGSTDGAMAISAPPGSYTLQVVGADNGTGLALVEIYDTGGSGGPAHLINLSARANVGTGTAVLIGGFAVGGSTADMVLLRGVGPGLTDTFGLTGTLAQPLLSVFDNGRNLIGSNAGWGGDPTLASVAGTVGAFALNTGHRDSALVVSLMPGAYTVEVSGADGGTGIALVEVYEVP